MSFSNMHIKNILKDKPFEPETLITIVELLNEADIPSILWGNSMLDIYGVPIPDIDMSFIVDRNSIEKARELLITAGLVECILPTCPLRAPNTPEPMTRPNGHFHFHFPVSDRRYSKDAATVQLHIRDERIWTLPPGDNKAHIDGNIIMAADPRLKPPNWGTGTGHNPMYGRCRHYEGSPVRILTPECYADALVLLLVRDRGTMASVKWVAQINYLMQYKVFDREKVHPSTKRYMTYPPEVSHLDNIEKAILALGDISDGGKEFAKWAN